MSYSMGQDEGIVKKAGAGTMNAIILAGSIIGVWFFLIRETRKKPKRGRTRKYTKATPRNLP